MRQTLTFLTLVRTLTAAREIKVLTLRVLCNRAVPRSRVVCAHLRVREGRHIVLQRAQLVHVVLAHDVWSAGQHLARLDERRPQYR